MYAKSMIEFARARAIERGWSKYLYGAPVVLALAVASLPFALKRDVSGPRPVAQPQGQPQQPAQAQQAAPVPQVVTLIAPTLTPLPMDQRQRAVAGFITRKYGVSADVVQEFVRWAFTAGKQYGVDPLLVVAMMAVESSFNPIAESFAGAKGLMQIIPKYHPEKFMEFGGEHAVFDPRVNIVVGARILREYLMMASGDLFTALQTYAGALADKRAVYAHRVLNEKDQLDDLTGLPKTDRAVRQVELGPLLSGISPRIVVPPPAQPAPVVAPLAAPAAPYASQVPAGVTLTQPRVPDEPAHTPPTPGYTPSQAVPPSPQLQPQQQPATSPYNMT
jgi:hypothetical protein